MMDVPGRGFLRHMSIAGLLLIPIGLIMFGADDHVGGLAVAGLGFATLSAGLLLSRRAMETVTPNAVVRIVALLGFLALAIALVWNAGQSWRQQRYENVVLSVAGAIAAAWVFTGGLRQWWMKKGEG